MIYISNSFSLNMLPTCGADTSISRARLEDVDYARKAAEAGIAKSIIGHPDLARICGFQYNRETITLQVGDILLVAQYRGPRLPEGAMSLPEGVTITWMIIGIHNYKTVYLFKGEKYDDFSEPYFTAIECCGMTPRQAMKQITPLRVSNDIMEV